MDAEVEDITNKNAKQQRMLNIRKEKSRDAARNRRSKENVQYVELAKLLPLPESITSQLDKASVIRLTISFLKYRELTGEKPNYNAHFGNPFHHHQKSIMGSVYQKQNPRKSQQVAQINNIEKNMGFHMLQALDGFLFCVAQDGKFLYVSETVSSHLGLSQLDLIGTSCFNIIHPDDYKEFSELLCSPIQPSYPNFMNIDDFDAMTYAEMNRKMKQGYISIFIRMKCALVKRGSSFLKSSGFKVIHISGQMVPFKSLDHKGEQAFALVATGQPLPPPTICELKLDTKVFVSRVGMDLKIAFCEGKIRKYMNFTARDIVGMNAYEFYHLNDMQIVQDAHADCIQGGKCLTRAYRWMNKTGGWVWMQTVGTVIKRNTPRGEEQQILCVNYISSDVEHEDEVIHTIQMRFKQLALTEKSNSDDMSDYGVDNSDASRLPSSNEIIQNSSSSNISTSEVALDRDSYLLSLQHYKATQTANQGSCGMISDAPASQQTAQQNSQMNAQMSSMHSMISAIDENTLRMNANSLANSQLTSELMMNPLPQLMMSDDIPSSPDSSTFDGLSPGFRPAPSRSFQPPHKDVFQMRSTLTQQSSVYNGHDNNFNQLNMEQMNLYDMPNRVYMNHQNVGQQQQQHSQQMRRQQHQDGPQYHHVQQQHQHQNELIPTTRRNDEEQLLHSLNMMSETDMIPPLPRPENRIAPGYSNTYQSAPTTQSSSGTSNNFNGSKGSTNISNTVPLTHNGSSYQMSKMNSPTYDVPSPEYPAANMNCQSPDPMSKTVEPTANNHMPLKQVPPTLGNKSPEYRPNAQSQQRVNGMQTNIKQEPLSLDDFVNNTDCSLLGGQSHMTPQFNNTASQQQQQPPLQLQSQQQMKLQHSQNMYGPFSESGTKNMNNSTSNIPPGQYMQQQQSYNTNNMDDIGFDAYQTMFFNMQGTIQMGPKGYTNNVQHNMQPQQQQFLHGQQQNPQEQQQQHRQYPNVHPNYLSQTPLKHEPRIPTAGFTNTF